MSSLKLGIYSCVFVICLVFVIQTEANLFCLQCSWSNVDTYTANGSIANSSSTRDDMCDVVDLKNIIAFPKPWPNPIVNPMCTYPDDYNTYKDLLQGPCYDYACFAKGMKCIKWTMFQGNSLINETRLCAVADEIGCFSQNKDSGYIAEVCICDDQQYCNSATVIHTKKYYIIHCIIINFIWWQL